MNYIKKYDFWLMDEYFDNDTKNELYHIRNKPKEIKDRFDKELEFGTGGLRGIMGAGTNRMNIYTVQKASQGLAAYIANKGEEAKKRGIVIAYDSRRQSEGFSQEAAKVFAGNGIKVYLFNELKPTPILSFAVRHLHAAAGVVITASHNPKEYNGYKVYGEDGAQLVPGETSAISCEIGMISDITKINLMSSEDAKKAGLLEIIGEEIDDVYISRIKKLAVNHKNIEKYGDLVKIIYTPLHGTGNKSVRRILAETGFKNVWTVEAQQYPDADFPSLKSTINPEHKEVYRHAVRLAKKENADLILATDPDCDRVGVMVKKSAGRYMLLTGNQAGALILDYILSQKLENASLPENGFIVKTIVTTELAKIIAKHYNVELVNVLTGFKYIGEKIKEMDECKNKKFLFGMEDSCGYLTGTEVRDKDGVIGCMLAAEVAAYYSSKGLTLYEGLQLLYKKYGFFLNELITLDINGDEALQKLKVKLFENAGHEVFKPLDIAAVRNYGLQKRYDIISGEYSALELPKSDVLYYECKDGSWFCIRPSGTESKIKIYFESNARTYKLAKNKLYSMKKTVLRKIKKMIR